MKKLLFDFVDSNSISFFKMMGFTVKIDDAINDVYYVEFNFDDNNYDEISILSAIDECIYEGVGCKFQYGNKIYELEEAYKIYDDKCAKIN